VAATSKPKVKLYMFPGSNSVKTGQLMLDHKGVEYKLVKLPPGPHAFIMLALGFETMGVPAMKWNGRRVQGTRAISRALDELVPARPLFPADPVQRKAVQDAERWGEDLQNATRRVFYAAARRDHKAFTSVMTKDRSLPARVFLRVGAGAIIRLASGAHRATDFAAREDLELLPERLDQIDAWIAEGLLGGPELNAADFQIAVNVAAIMTSDDLRPLVEGRPAGALARRVVGDYGGHIGRVLPPDWMPRRQLSAGPSGVPQPPAGGTVAYGTGAYGAAAAGATASGRAEFLRSAGIGEAKIAELLGEKR
jgi:glutathione S-transferase